MNLAALRSRRGHQNLNIVDTGADVLTGVDLAACCRVHCQLEARRALGMGTAVDLERGSCGVLKSLES